MKLFFQFFWMGMSKLLYVLLCISAVITYIVVPILIAITFGSILKKVMHLALAIIFSMAIAIICYCIIYIIYHSIKAVKHFKKSGSDSLKNSWKETGIDWSTYY